VVIKVKLIVIELRKMKNIQVELTYFKEQQEALNESIKEKFHSVEERIQSLRRQTEEYNGTISTAVQIQSIRSELVTFEERIRGLEDLNQTTNKHVIIISNRLSL
jgi:hypothetical protein